MSKSINDYEYSYCHWDCWPSDEPEPDNYLDCFPVHIFRTKIDGQTVEVEFASDEINRHQGVRHWNIGLTIGTKRKKFSNYHQRKDVSGKIGIKGLLFAKAAIQHFEQYYIGKDNALYAHWLDNRRRDVYAYGLKKMGFEFRQHNGHKVLYKIIEK